MRFLREKLKIYPNEPELLSNLAFALRNYYFYQGKADTDELKKAKSNEITALCERALKYYKPTDDNSFPKQQLIIHYIFDLHDKEKASVYNIITKPENGFCELFAGSERFERLVERLKEKISK